MNRSAELLLALSEDKEEKKLTVLFLAVVNIVLLRTNLLICGDKERSLAGNGLDIGLENFSVLITSLIPFLFSSARISVASFADGKLVSDFVMDLGGLVSRKKDFIPAVTSAVKKGWTDRA